MTIDKDKLRALAEAATPGDEWYGVGDLRYVDEKGGDVHGLHHHDDSFIASANPATILALLGEIERLETQARLAGVSAEVAVHQAVGRAVTRELVLTAERDQLKAENEALAHLLKRFVDGEHDDVEDQSDRHHYHGEAQALLARMSGDFQEYSLVPYEALWKQRTELVGLRRDAERYRWLREKVGVDFIFGDFNPWLPAEGADMTALEKQTTDESIDAAMAKEQSHG